MSSQLHTSSFLLGAVAASAATALLMAKLLMKPKIERFDVDSRFTDVVRHGNLVFMSGQLGDGTTIEEQTASALDYIDKALAQAGSDKTQILELTIWLADMEQDYDAMNRVYDQWLVPGMPPCRACVQAKLAKPEWKIEIRCIASV
jgi:enamine deaminase RidA (YjgF/YER057c/UK114 family)